MLNYRASPTVDRFLASRKFFKGLMGPIGGGKSTGALMDLFSRAVTQEPFNGVRRTRFGILRNTTSQLRTTVKPLLDTWFVDLVDGRMGSWTQTTGVLTFEARLLLADGTRVEADFMLLAADTPDDVRRLLSLELTAAWIEEAREVDEAVVEGLTGRVGRYPSLIMGGATFSGVIFSTNPPPLGSYWHDIIAHPPANADVFVQPSALLEDGSVNPEADNLENLPPDYYDNLVEGKTEEWVNVYLKNEFGQGNMGRPVFRASFKRAFHVAKESLRPILQSLHPLVIGMDNGLQAAASVTQRDARQRVNVLAECYVPEDETMGVETFLDRLLIPMLKARFPDFREDKIVFSLDPACFQRAQVNEMTIALAVQKRGYRVFKPATNDPERRQQAVENLLAMQIDGGPALVFDPSCIHLIEGMEWGYRFKKSGSGLQVEKNHFSHQVESVEYAALMHNNGEATSWAVQRPKRLDIKPARYTYATARRTPTGAPT